MLIVPIVEGLNWRRPPPVTLALILLNVLVFFLYQSGDAGREQKAVEAYFGSSLPRIELPAYNAYLARVDPKAAQQVQRAIGAALSENAADPMGRRAVAWLFARMENDPAFMRELRAGRVVDAQHPRYAQWKDDRARVDSLEGAISYRRFGFTPADPRAVTWITSMFLHGDLMHLAGNMVFLFIVGVAVESALGGSWYLLLYLAGGIAGDALHYAVHPSSTIPSVGASGAISGLMGLFTVVFGLRQVNFFYWLVFFFGFRRLRGIVVLPIWIGWEITQYALNRESSIGYMAHAGGLIGGALLGMLVMKRFSGAERVAQFHEQRDQEALDRAEYEKARALVARLDFTGAGTVFARLAQRFPAEATMIREWYAVAKADPASESFHRASAAVLSIPRPDANLRAFQRQVFGDYFARAQPQPRLDPAALAAAGIVFARGGHLAEAERAAQALFKQAPGAPQLPVLWDALAGALSAPGCDTDALVRAKRYRALIGARARAEATA